MAWCWPGNKPFSEPMMVNLLMQICVIWAQWFKAEMMKKSHHCIEPLAPTQAPLLSNQISLIQGSRINLKNLYCLQFCHHTSLNCEHWLHCIQMPALPVSMCPCRLQVYGWSAISCAIRLATWLLALSAWIHTGVRPAPCWRNHTITGWKVGELLWIIYSEKSCSWHNIPSG